MKKRNIGSSFDDFLEEEDLLEEAEETAVKRVVAFQIKRAMKVQKINKATMAKKMKTSRTQVDRLLSPNNESVTLQTLKKAAFAVNRNLRIELV